MRVVGFVPAKGLSNRFPRKNLALLKEVPLFWHSVGALLDAESVLDVFVVTDDPEIKSYSEQRGCQVIHRPSNISRSDQSIFSVIRFAYQSLSTEYDVVVCVMANCPGHQGSDIDAACELFAKNPVLREVRGVGIDKLESGLLAFRSCVFDTTSSISNYLGFIQTNALEVHYQEDLDAILNKLFT